MDQLPIGAHYTAGKSNARFGCGTMFFNLYLAHRVKKERKKERKEKKRKRGSGLNVKNKGSGLCCRDDDDAFFFILGFFFANGKQKEARTHVRVVEIKPQKEEEEAESLCQNSWLRDASAPSARTQTHTRGPTGNTYTNYVCVCDIHSAPS